MPVPFVMTESLFSQEKDNSLHVTEKNGIPLMLEIKRERLLSRREKLQIPYSKRAGGQARSSLKVYRPSPSSFGLPRRIPLRG